jgi:BMFP domain-containing protein YqiC
MQPPFLNELSAKLSARVNELVANSPARDLEANLRTLMGSFFSRLDLVTREEFDIQAKVLARTREKLEALEAKIAALEQRPGK